MQAQVWKQHLVSGLAIGAVLVTVTGCSSAQNREAAAVNEFHQRLAQGRIDLIYSSASDSLRAQLSEAQFRQSLSEASNLGQLQDSEQAHVNRTTMPGGSEVVLAFYNSRYAKAACLESFTWHIEKDDLKLATYSCARNMQVSCPGGVAGDACETSPAPAPTTTLGLASLP